jgi:uncharacterized protein YndB with AHSA1/START domain
VSAIGPAAAVVRRVLPAPPEVVFDEWVDPEALKEWMCPLPARAAHIELDVRVGGRIRIDVEEDGSAFTVTGTYLRLDRPTRLAFTWSCSTWAVPDLETIVTVTLEPHGDSGTQMTIHHQLPDELRADHERGWTLIAQQLDQQLRSVI